MESSFLRLHASSFFFITPSPNFIPFFFNPSLLPFPSLFPLNTSLTNWLTSLHEYPKTSSSSFFFASCLMSASVFHPSSLFLFSAPLILALLLSFFFSLSPQWFDYFLLFLQAYFLRQIVRAGCRVRRGREGRDGRTGTRELSFTFISLLKTLHRKLLQTYHR